MSGFNDWLMAWLPGMIEYELQHWRTRRLLQRLRRGTYLWHILEHVTLELQNLAGSRLGYGRARETTTEGVFRVAFKYEEEAIASGARAGAAAVPAAVHDTPFDAVDEVRQLRLLADDSRMGPTTMAMADAVRAWGISVWAAQRCQSGAVGARREATSHSPLSHDRTGAVAEAISDDKNLTKEYLRSAGVPVAKGRLVTSAADAWLAAQEIGTPVVVKPRIATTEMA